jgi:hypothetical protein
VKIGDRVDIPILDHLFEPRIGLRALVGLHQLFAPVWQQVGDRFDDAIRMFIPVKLQPEASTGNAEPNFAAGDLARTGRPGQRPRRWPLPTGQESAGVKESQRGCYVVRIR